MQLKLKCHQINHCFNSAANTNHNQDSQLGRSAMDWKKINKEMLKNLAYVHTNPRTACI